MSATPKPKPSQYINDPNLFLSSVQGDFNDATIDDSGYGALPAVEQNQTYFVYYDGATKQDPELIKQTAFKVKYLIDANGNIVKPQPDDPSLFNIIDNFELGKPVIVTTKTPTTVLSPLLGEKIVTHVGELSTILATGFGPGKYDNITTMEFQNILGVSLANTASNFSAVAKLTKEAVFGNTTGIFPYPSPNTIWQNFLKVSAPTSQVNSWTVTNQSHPTSGSMASTILNYGPYGDEYIHPIYTFAVSTSDVNQRISMRVRFNAKTSVIGEQGSSTLTVGFFVKRNGLTTWQLLEQGTQWFYADYYSDRVYYSQFYDFNVGDQVTFFMKINITNQGPVYFPGLPDVNQYFEIVNENTNFSGLVNGVTGCTASYWSVGTYVNTGENPQYYTTWITASQGLNAMYKEGTVQTLPQNVLDYKYMQPWQPWYTILPGDFITFENNKNKNFIITEVNTENLLSLRLYPGLQSGSNLDHFCIYRILNNGYQIMIDQEKPPETGDLEFRGFIRPKYISQELEDKFVEVINKLEADGLFKPENP